MNNCLLCQQHEADKTGSHIIPSFLMKRINGEGKRDNEIGVEIKNGIVETYFGRDIYEDKRKAITDNEEKLYSRENYDIKDHVFCKYCEKYFASLESKYAPSISLRFTEQTNTKNTKVSPHDALLFWCSVVWRASVTEHLGSRLKPELEERLRYALTSQNTDNLNIKYALFRCIDYSKKTGHGTSVCMDIKDNNLLLIVDEFMLVMVFDMKEEEHETELFNLNLKLKKDNLNDGKKVEEISPIPPHVFLQIMSTIIHLIIKTMNIPKKFIALHKQIFGKDMPDDILNEILNMMQNTGKSGDKYTIEHYAWCYKEVLIKHGLIQEIKDNTFSIISK